MATSIGFNVSSSPLLRLRSSSVSNVTQLPFISPLCRRRLVAERFGLATIVVSRQNLSVSPPSAAVEASISGKREPMTPPYNVLITGSTKGIGYALAREFLKAGDNVVICSRSDADLGPLEEDMCTVNRESWVCSVCYDVDGHGLDDFWTHLDSPLHESWLEDWALACLGCPDHPRAETWS